MLEILDEALKMDKSAKDNKEIYSELNWKSIFGRIAQVQTRVIKW
jgi:hypothetical protein